MGVRQGMVLIGNAMQAMSEGKSGSVETRITRPVAMALSSMNHTMIKITCAYRLVGVTGSLKCDTFTNTYTYSSNAECSKFLFLKR